MEGIFQVVLDLIEIWGYPAILIGMALESANIPIPSELIFGFAGYLVFLGRLDFNLAVTAGVIGGLLGSILSYSVGYYGGPNFVMKYGRYIFLSKKNVTKAQKWFDQYGLITVLVARLLPVVRTFISLPAGFARVNFLKFIVYTILGSVPWTIALIYIGMLLGENWHTMHTIGHEISLVVASGLFILGIYYIIRKGQTT
ncbi:DedA family protein [Pelosinus sp. sgz500959]|uniref:DedA family protein n=1 Tax=Pelosinus sp. sgz500959 TaxID=3242472 RepID=UPI00366AF55C